MRKLKNGDKIIFRTDICLTDMREAWVRDFIRDTFTVKYLIGEDMLAVEENQYWYYVDNFKSALRSKQGMFKYL